jgi:hypothetical protein
MAFNLVRNSRVFFTTNVDSTTGNVLGTGFTTGNTQEIQVLDGFTFSQNTNAETITLSEAGDTPVRGQRAFNTSLAPVDFAMSTYLRPSLSGSIVSCEESVLWNALLGTEKIDAKYTVGGVSGATYSNTTGVVTIAGTLTGTSGIAVGNKLTIAGLGGTGAAKANTSGTVTAVSGSAIAIKLDSAPATALTLTAPTTIYLHKGAWVAHSNYSTASSGTSDKNQLQKFGMIFVVDSVVYVVDNCALTQATVDFGLDAISMVAWTGQGTRLRQIGDTAFGTSATVSITDNSGNSSGLAGSANGKNTAANYITNKLSTVTLVSGIAGLVGGSAGTEYNVALTGGSITFNNNISYLTPANLGVVNLPITYFTATRAVSGTLNAYLRTGAGVSGTGALLNDLLANAATAIDPKFALNVAIGGKNSSVRIELDMPGAMISIPTVDVQQVVSTTINFTAQGHDIIADTYDISTPNELVVRYYSA